MKNVKRVLAMMFVMVLLAVLPMTVFATEETTTTASEETTTTTEPTTTTTAAPTVPLSNLYVVGSNNKNYLADPSVSASVNKYSFYLPDWMETCTLVMKSGSSFTAESEGVTFEGSSGTTTGEFKLEESRNTFTVKLKSGDIERTLTIVIYLSEIPCKLESVSLIRNDDVIKSFTSGFDKAEYTFASGTTTASLRIVPRHEQTVTITNLTGIPAENVTGQEPAVTLNLHETYKRYDTTLNLVEGTNLFVIKVKAGDVEIKCNLTIIVGDPLANATTTTVTTESTTIPTVPPTAPPTENVTQPTTAPQQSGGTTSSFPPVLWVTIGVVIAVVLGACIFMIVNMGNKENERAAYDDYDRQPRYPVRRNLTDYVDDEYRYAPPPAQRGSRGPAPRGGYYNSNSYNNYTDGYNPNPPAHPSGGGYQGGYQGGGDYADYGRGGDYGSSETDYSGVGFTGDYDDGYGSGTPRGGSSSLSGFESDDDYGSGNYYGGY